MLSILDLIRILTQFDDHSQIGREVGELMEIYQNNNVRPKYVKEVLVINFERFHQMVGESCIIKELQYALVDSYMKPLSEDGEPHVAVFVPPHRHAHQQKAPGYVELQDKKKYYNYDAIFDKDLLRLKQEL